LEGRFLKRLAVLGSTGSIGQQTLDVVAHHRDRFRIVALAAGFNLDLARQQALAHRPALISMATVELADRLRADVPDIIKVVHGEEGLIEVATHHEADFVVSALVGSMGLRPTLAAIAAGKTIGLANKETLISAGHIVQDYLQRHNVRLLPIDSEHSAIFQCLNGERQSEVQRMILTASGGSFRDLRRDQLEHVTVTQALNHPNWSMGAKITIDSATMVNKGLEIIEAHWLFSMPYDKIEIVIHPESIIHSMVEFCDRSIIAQIGHHDMRIPIQYALSWPDRIAGVCESLDFTKLNGLHFRELDTERYPCVEYAYECGRLGGSAPTVFNAANEIAVARFLRGEIRFLEIERIIENVIHSHQPTSNPDLEEIFYWDAWARSIAQQYTALI
jgi:1-deoxy-D-xylulose-5-phosphate reductoisomerase